MNISTTPYQRNSYWYARDISIASPIAATTAAPQINGIPQPRVADDLNQLSKITPAPNGSIAIQKIENTTFSAGKDTTSATGKEISTSDAVQKAKSDKVGQERSSSSSGSVQESALTEEELALLQELKKTDSEVRTHEMAHIAAGGQYVTSGAQLEYRKGPDGSSYAVAGEVSIDTSPVSGDPAATAAKMRQVQRAALAPASPSSQDRKVAASAGAIASKALSELITSQARERTAEDENRAFGTMQSANRRSGDMRNGADIYSKINAMPLDRQVNRFEIAV